MISEKANEQMNRRINLLCCLVLLLIVGLSFSGCNNSILEYRDYTVQNSINPGYKTLTVTEGIAHFSFDYPANGVVPSVQTGQYATLVSFSKDGIDPGIRILVFIDNTNRPSYRDWIPDETLESNPAVFAGNQGQQLRFLRKYGISPVYHYSALYFDHNGMVWEIEVESHNTVPETDEAELERFLETFKILG